VKEEKAGSVHIVSGTLEEILAYMAEAEEEANARPLLPSQREIDWGSYVFSVEEVGEGEALAIFGHVWSFDEWQEKEKRAGATQEELDYSSERIVDAHERGYRYGEYWSVATFGRPDIGSKHISVLWPISRRDFEYARRIDWRLNEEFFRRVQEQVRQEAAHATTKEELDEQ
jgi:hypothetical protein